MLRSPEEAEKGERKSVRDWILVGRLERAEIIVGGNRVLYGAGRRQG